MKLIIAIIRPVDLTELQSAWERCTLDSVTVSQVLDLQEQEATVESYRGNQFRRPAQKLRLEIVVENSSAQDVINVIKRTGPAKVIVLDVEDPVELTTFWGKRVTGNLVGM